MRTIAYGLTLAAALSLALVPVASPVAQDAPKKEAKKPAPKKAATQKTAAKSGNCVQKGGRGWAPTEGMARFQAWEIVAQTTGNWPIQTDTFKNERYKCNPEGSGWKCLSWIDVCKKA